MNTSLEKLIEEFNHIYRNESISEKVERDALLDLIIKAHAAGREEVLEEMTIWSDKKYKIHQEIIRMHDILPKDWHEGNMNAFSDICSKLYELRKE